MPTAPVLSAGAPAEGGAAPPDAVSASSHVSVEQLFEHVVRRIAWSGDGRRGSARIELGSGALAGAVILVHADRGEVHVAVQLPAGADAAGWRARFQRRMTGDRVQIASLSVE